MTRLSKDFTFEIKEGTDPRRAYQLGVETGSAINLFLKLELGKELLKEYIKDYPEIKIIKW